MGIRLIFLNIIGSDKNIKFCLKKRWYNYKFYIFQEKTILKKYRTKTDTGKRVEYTKALGLTILKELGKLHP